MWRLLHACKAAVLAQIVTPQTGKENEMTDTNQQQRNNKAKRPDKIARIRIGSGKSATFETVGAAWTRDDGSVYLKPYGRQIIDQPIYIFDSAGLSPDQDAEPVISAGADADDCSPV